MRQPVAGHRARCRARWLRKAPAGWCSSARTPARRARASTPSASTSDRARLTPLGLAAATPNPSFLAISPDRRFLFAVNETAVRIDQEKSGSVRSFSIDAATGKLTELSVQSSRGADPCHLAVDRTGRFLAVANYTGGNFALFPIGADGRLGPASAVLTQRGIGTEPRAAGLAARARGRLRPGAIAFSSAPTSASIACSSIDSTRRAARSPRTRRPPRRSRRAPVPGTSRFIPNGRQLFSINELTSTVTEFLWDTRTGTLTAAPEISTLPPGGQAGNSTAELVVHPNGRVVYASNRGHDSIAVFATDVRRGLSLVEIEPTRGQTPRNFALDVTGRWLLAANQRSGTLAVFAIDAKTGALTPSGPLAPVGAPVCILFVS